LGCDAPVALATGSGGGVNVAGNAGGVTPGARGIESAGSGGGVNVAGGGNAADAAASLGGTAEACLQEGSAVVESRSAVLETACECGAPA